ncbi:MAG TPA: tetratricopeptide repeat protein [Bacteroidota bacterium]|nr:tetratricopeptide repeat protein [Bacteroidota bacterium]
MRSGIAFIFFIIFATGQCAAQNTKENADFKLALNLFNDKLYDLSLDQFKQFISAYPSSSQTVEAKFYVALAERALKKDDDARAAFQNFALTYPDNPKAPDAWWNMGEMFSEEGKWGEAASAFERIKVFQPKSSLAPKALLTASKYFERAGNDDDAKRCLRSLISDYPTDENVTAAHAQLGALYLKENNPLAARRELLLVTQSGGDKETIASAEIQLGTIDESSGNPDEAEQLYRSIIDEKKAKLSATTIGRAKLQLASLYTSTGKRPEAIDILRKLCADSAHVPQDILQEGLLALGKNCFAVRDFKQAADAFMRSLSHPADSALVVSALMGAGRSFDALDEFRRSFSTFSLALDHPLSDTEKDYATLRAAMTAADIKKYDVAVHRFEECLREFPNDGEAPEILFRAAEIYRRDLNDEQKAVDLYENFLIRYPENEQSDDALFSLGLAHESLHETSEAIKCYDKLVNVYPSSPLIKQALERKEFLQRNESPNEDQTVKQLALLIGDLILEKERSDLALRLGDIYLNVLQDFPQAVLQYAKAESVSKDSTVKEKAAFMRTVAMSRQCELDTSYVPAALSAVDAFLKAYPNGPFSDEASYDRFVIGTKNASPAQVIDSSKRSLDARPQSRFAPRILLALGEAERDRGLLHESIETFKKIATTYPVSPEADEATAQLGIQLAHLGSNDTASVVLTGYLRVYPRGYFCAEVLYELGMLSVRAQQPLIAATSFEQLRAKYFYSPRSVECIGPLAQSYAKTQQYDKAIALYRQELERLSSPLHIGSKETPVFVLQLAQTYDAANDTANAMKQYLDFVGEDSQSPEAAFAFERLAAFAQHKGEVDAAVNFLEKSTAAQKSAMNTQQLASLYFGQSEYEKAIEEYEEFLGLTGIDSASARESRIHIIAAMFRSDKNKEAELEIKNFLKEYGPDKNASAKFEFEKAMALYREGEFDEALAILHTFPSKFDSSEILPQASFWVGKILEAKELPDSALQQYDFVMKAFPRSEILPKVYLALGNIYFYKEKYDDAVKYYRLIVDKPDAPPDVLPYAMSNLIEAYKEVALYDGALELTRTFIEKYPNDESILDKKVDLGILYQKLGYYDQAILQLQSLLETTNKDLESEIRYYLGETYYYKGDYQQAILEFLKVPYLITKKTKIDWTPNSYYMSAQSYEKMGKFDQALNMYQQIIDKPGIDPAIKTAAQKEIDRVKSLVKQDLK